MISVQQSVTEAQEKKGIFFFFLMEGRREGEIKESMEVLSSVLAHQER